MARKVLVTQTCDYEHPEGDVATEEEPRHFSWDGQSYEIDLCGPHGLEFDQAMNGWADRARAAEPERPEPRSVRAPRKRQTAATPETREFNSKVRSWAKQRGFYVADRGRIPTDVIAGYEKANPSA